MAITLKTITGKIVIPGTTTGIRATVTATPMTDSRALTFSADDTISWGPVVGTTDAAGNLPTSFKIPTSSDQQAQLLWRFTAEPIDKHAGLPKSWLMGEYQITDAGTIDLADLIDVDVLGIDTSTYVTIQNYVASAQAAATSAAAASTSAAASATLAQTLVTSDLGTTDGQSFALVSDPNSLTGGHLHETFVALDAATNVLSGKVEVKGAFTNPFDSTVWIAPAVRTDPADLSQALYAVHRVAGDMGAQVHDAMATELIVYSATNTSYLNAFESTVKIEDAGNTIADMRAITANFMFSSDAAGAVTNASVIRAQGAPALPAGLTIDTVYGVYVEQQTRGAENWSVYAPGGNSLFGKVVIDASAATTKDFQFTNAGSLRWIIRMNTTAESGGNSGSDLEFMARTDDAGLHLSPLKIVRSSGQVQVNNGLKVTGAVGFNGNTPIAQRAATADATDLATAITLVNALKADLVAYGLKAS